MFRRFWRALGVFGCGRGVFVGFCEFSSSVSVAGGLGCGSVGLGWVADWVAGGLGCGRVVVRAGWFGLGCGAGGLVCGGVRAAGWGQFDVFEKYILPENVELVSEFATTDADKNEKTHVAAGGVLWQSGQKPLPFRRGCFVCFWRGQQAVEDTKAAMCKLRRSASCCCKSKAQ